VVLEKEEDQEDQEDKEEDEEEEDEEEEDDDEEEEEEDPSRERVVKRVSQPFDNFDREKDAKENKGRRNERQRRASWSSPRSSPRPNGRIFGEKTISAPTPENGRGSISARVRFLQQRCVKVLGEETYDSAYTFLKDAQDGEMSQEDIERILGKMVGKHRVPTFGNLIEQILFMEQC